MVLNPHLLTGGGVWLEEVGHCGYDLEGLVSLPSTPLIPHLLPGCMI